MRSVFLRGFLVVVVVIFLSPKPGSGYGIDDSYIHTSGNTFDFTIYAGEFLIVEAFWTDCGHCHDFHPTMVRLYNSYNTEIKILSLAIWPDRDSLSSVKTYLQSYPSSWDYGVDPDGTFDNTYGISATPTTLLFSRAGDRLFTWRGVTDYEDLTSVIDSYLSGVSLSYSTFDPIVDDDVSAGSVFGDFVSNPMVRITGAAIILVYAYLKLFPAKPAA